MLEEWNGGSLSQFSVAFYNVEMVFYFYAKQDFYYRDILNKNY